MKRYLLTALAILLALCLCACGCKHEWAEANCTSPKTCTLCQTTEGEPLGHSLVEATCEKAQTCTICGITEGEALGHSWEEADCENPRSCAACGITEGEALGHIWADATTEAPKTCTVCSVTEGEPLATDPRFVTEVCQPLFGTWKGQLTTTTEENGLTGVEGEIVFDVVFTFYPDGTVTQQSSFADWESTMLLFREYYVLLYYSQMAAAGMDAAEAEAAMKSQYNMTVEEYAQYCVDAIDPDAVAQVVEMVYYSEGNTLFMGYSWDSEMMVVMWSIEGDVMTQIMLPEMSMIQLTRVEE